MPARYHQETIVQFLEMQPCFERLRAGRTFQAAMCAVCPTSEATVRPHRRTYKIYYTIYFDVGCSVYPTALRGPNRVLSISGLVSESPFKYIVLLHHCKQMWCYTYVFVLRECVSLKYTVHTMLHSHPCEMFSVSQLNCSYPCASLCRSCRGTASRAEGTPSQGWRRSNRHLG